MTRVSRMTRMIDRSSHASFTAWPTTTAASCRASPSTQCPTTTTTTARLVRRSGVYAGDDSVTRPGRLRKLYAVIHLLQLKRSVLLPFYFLPFAKRQKTSHGSRGALHLRLLEWNLYEAARSRNQFWCILNRNHASDDRN